MGQQTAEAAPRERRRLGEILIAAGVIEPADLAEALEVQRTSPIRRRLGDVLVDLGLCTDQDIARALSDQLGLELVHPDKLAPEPAALQRVPRRLAERHQLLPLRIEPGDVLVVAMADPTNVLALDDVRLSAGMREVRPVVAPASELGLAIRYAYGGESSALDIVEDLEVPEQVEAVEEALPESIADVDIGQPIVRLANAILSDAVRSRASDVHVEPERDGVRVRYRIDGLLHEKMTVPTNLGPALTSRLKIIANLDIAERRLPQDGRATLRIEGQEVDVRVSTMPTLFGETVVLRLLRRGVEKLRIGDLGMASDTRELFEAALSRPQGLILITGPTGSGKTTTLYAGLMELADPTRNIITLEDPVEYQLDGVNQTQINPKIGLTFARGLRTVLRQDPDVVMVGEIRDRETAELAMQASFTGHLVLSTLHTNDAPSTIVRLHDLGVERFMIASSIVLVVAQRLVRVVCPHCAAPDEPDPRTIRLLGLTDADLEGADLRRGTGCAACDHTGYLGRVGVYEALPITSALRDVIAESGTETALRRIAREQGMRTLREDGLLKARAGITTLDEVLRITPEEDLVVPGFGTPLTDVGPPEIGLPAVEDRTRPNPAAERETDREPSGTALRVLVVEDDPSVRALLGTMLVEDHVVLEAATVEEALRLARYEHPDAIIVDYRLPDGDGITLTRTLRADPETADVAVLMITGVGDTELEVEGLLAGVDDYLTKPFEEEVLRARLVAALRRVRRR